MATTHKDNVIVSTYVKDVVRDELRRRADESECTLETNVYFGAMPTRQT